MSEQAQRILAQLAKLLEQHEADGLDWRCLQKIGSFSGAGDDLLTESLATPEKLSKKAVIRHSVLIEFGNSPVKSQGYSWPR